MKLKKFVLLALVLTISLGSIGCDSNKETDEFEAILGDWMQVESDPEVDLFIRVTREEIIIAGSSTLTSTVACTTLQINDYNADTGVMNVTDSDGDMATSSVKASGDGVIVDGDTYVRSNSFPTCTVNLSILSFNDTLERTMIPGASSGLR